MASSSQPDDVCLITAIGSEFALKGLLTLEASGVRYTNVNLPITSLKKYLAPPSQVPVLCWGTEVIQDSTEIIKFLDKKTGKGLFPPASTPEGAKVVAMEDESDNVLSPLLRYYALYDQAGFDRCFRKKVTEAVPLGLGFLVIPFLGGTRAHFKDVLQKAVPSLDTNNPAAVRAFLDALLARYEAGLPSAESGYLCGTKSASAADISVLSLLERMVSQTGDAAFPPCLPDALDNKPKMQAWLQRMEAEFSISYLKHERPKSMPRPPALLRDL